MIFADLSEAVFRNSTVADLVGKQIHHNWTDFGVSYVTSFCNDTHLIANEFRETVLNPEIYATTYERIQVSKDVVQYLWKMRVALSDVFTMWTFNFATETIYVTITNDHADNLHYNNTFVLVDGLEVREGFTKCAEISEIA